MLRELILKNRTCRRFYQEVKMDRKTLEGCIDLARNSASAANKQSLKYVISTDEAKNQEVFKELRWAGYMKDWPGPKEGERPCAYIVMLGDKSISEDFFWDPGIAAQSILLGAVEQGYGGCIFGSADKDGIRRIFSVPNKYEVILVIGLGKPKEKAVLEEVNSEGDIRYWRDEDQVHHVPKRKLEDIILNL